MLMMEDSRVLDFFSSVTRTDNFSQIGRTSKMANPLPPEDSMSDTNWRLCFVRIMQYGYLDHRCCARKLSLRSEILNRWSKIVLVPIGKQYLIIIRCPTMTVKVFLYKSLTH